jgi:DNA-binding MarR family transcriptional regulator
MTPVSTKKSAERQKLASDVRDALRDLRIQLARLNYRVGSGLGLKDVDLDVFDIVDMQGPLTPTALARHAGLHPATMTGILDRLERDGWIIRERDPSDRRAVLVRALRDRQGELLGRYADMARSMNKLIASYSDTELEVIADFLRRSAEAGHDATDKLADE